MSETKTLHAGPERSARVKRRERRADRTRAEALSPVRLVIRVLALPIVISGVALSVYLRTSPYESPEAMMHLVARAGCDAAGYIGLAPAYRGELGYHARNDTDGDGVACEAAVSSGSLPLQGQGFGAPAPTNAPSERMVGGAKFIKP